MLFQSGKNVLYIDVSNAGGRVTPTNPAGLVAVVQRQSDGKILVVTDSTWGIKIVST